MRTGNNDNSDNKKIPPGYPSINGLEWQNKRSFSFEGHEFDTMQNSADFLTDVEHEREGRFFMAKNVTLMQKCITLFRELKPKNFVELGIHRGGSVAFLYLLARPEKMLALELAPDRLPKLDQFIAGEKLEDRLRVEYGVDQGDTERVRQLTDAHLGTRRNIDLVLDDASHLLRPTRSSFECLFPRIRPGGCYVVEDFAASQMAAANCFDDAAGGSPPAQKLFRELMKTAVEDDLKPCHLLAVEALLASIVAPRIVSRVAVDKHWLKIVRGPGDVEDPDNFDLRALACDRFGLLDYTPSAELKQLLSSGAA